MFKVDELLKATAGKLICGSRNLSVKGVSIDSRTIKKGEAFVAIKGNNFDGHRFIAETIKKGAKAVIVQLPITNGSTALTIGPEQCRRANYQLPIAIIQVKDTIKALGDLARFQRQKFAIPVIAVTGSNGKTTTKEMISWVLSKKFKVLKPEGTKNNQIGLPMTLLHINSSYDFVVLEIGTNHFGEVDYLARIAGPNIAIITNIGPAHLQFFKDIKGVFKEKATLLKHLHKPRIAILNADDELLRKQILSRNRQPFTFSFGIKDKSDFLATKIKINETKIEFSVRKNRFILKNLGLCNIYNALAAIAVGRLLGMEYKDIALRLAHFEFPESRLNLKTLNNVKFIDDTYNSNPLSLEQALDTLENLYVKGRKIFVMGDMLELGGLSEKFHRLSGERIPGVCDAFITVGKFSKFAAQTAQIKGFDIKNIFTCDNSAEARDVLLNRVSPTKDDIVLVKGSRGMKMEEIFKT